MVANLWAGCDSSEDSRSRSFVFGGAIGPSKRKIDNELKPRRQELAKFIARFTLGVRPRLAVRRKVVEGGRS